MEPYYFRNSKHFPGKSLEYLLFNNSSAFFSLKDRPHRENDSMHQHINNLLKAGDNLNIKYLCPICGQRPVKYLIFRNCSYLSIKLSCCDNEECLQTIKGDERDRIIPVKLRSLRQFSKKENRKKAEQIFRQLLFLRPSSKPEEILKAIVMDKEKAKPRKAKMIVKQLTLF